MPNILCITLLPKFARFLLLACVYTVNSEIFVLTLFSRNFAYAKFGENKTLAKWQNHCMSFTEIGKSCISREFFTSLIIIQAFHTVRTVLYIGCSVPVVEYLNKINMLCAVNDPTTGPEHSIYRTMRTVCKA